MSTKTGTGKKPALSNGQLHKSQSRSPLPSHRDHSETDVTLLIEDLKTHQVELEMQNQELRETQQLLADEKERYTDLFDFAPVGFLILDGKGLITRLNLTAAGMLGITRGKVLNTPFSAYVEPLQVDDFFKFWLQLQKDQQALSCELGMRTKGSSRRFHARIEADPRREIQGAIRLAMVDITDRLRAEEALIEANENLETKVRERTAELGEAINRLKSANQEIDQRASRLKGLTSQLIQAEQRERRRVAQVLHDGLQQQLAAARLALGGLMDLNETRAKENLVDEVDRLLAESITTSRNLTTELSPPALYHGGLNGGLAWLAQWMGQKHGLTVDLSLEKIESDMNEDLKVLLFDSIRELLFNVLKHAQVRIARVQLETAGDALQITVSDQGRGFNPKKMKPAGPDGGFGLFSIGERLQTLGGRLVFESERGKGSRFRLHVPGVILPARTSERKIRLMLVDDHSAIREGLARLIGKERDLEIIGQASDGHGGVELAAKLRPDVVLMDIEMPGVDGIEATRRIHAERPQTKIIGFSMHTEGSLVQAMRDAGASAYLSKSCSLEELVKVIRESRLS